MVLGIILAMLLVMLLHCGCDPALATSVPLRASAVALATIHVVVMILRVFSFSVIDSAASARVAQLPLDVFQERAQHIDEVALGKIEVPVKQI